MNEVFQSLRDLLSENDDPRSSTNRDKISKLLLNINISIKYQSSDGIDNLTQLVKIIQTSNLDLITEFFECFEDLWIKIRGFFLGNSLKYTKELGMKSIFIILRACQVHGLNNSTKLLFKDIFKVICEVNCKSYFDYMSLVQLKMQLIKEFFIKEKISDFHMLLRTIFVDLIFNMIENKNRKVLTNDIDGKGTSSKGSNKSIKSPIKKSNSRESISNSQTAIIHHKHSTHNKRNYENLINECFFFLKKIISKKKISLMEEHFVFIVKYVCQLLIKNKKEIFFEILFLLLKKKNFSLSKKGYSILCCSLCTTVNLSNSFCQKSTQIMKYLLNNHELNWSYSILIEVLNYSPYTSFYRGAVFFVGVFSWGKYEIKELSKYKLITLKAMFKVISVNNRTLNVEIILSLNNLIDKYGKELILEWNVIFEILTRLSNLMVLVGKGKEAKESQKYHRHVLNCLLKIFKIHRLGKFLGSERKFLKLMIIYKKEIDEGFSFYLLDQIKIDPLTSGILWKSNITYIMTNFFKNEKKLKIKIKVIDKLKQLLSTYGSVYHNEILKLILPYVKNERSETIVYFFLWIIEKLDLTSNKFLTICGLITNLLHSEKLFSQKIKKEIINGILQIFMDGFDKQPVLKSKILFNFLIKMLPNLSVDLLKNILQNFRYFKSNRYYQLKIKEKVSPYLIVYNLVKTNTSPSPTSSISPTVVLKKKRLTLSCEIEVSKLMEVMSNFILTKSDVGLLDLLLNLILSFLKNYYIVKNISIDNMVYVTKTLFRQKFSLITRNMDLFLMTMEIIKFLIGYVSSISSSSVKKDLAELVFFIFKSLRKESKNIIKEKSLNLLFFYILEYSREDIEARLDVILSFIIEKINVGLFYNLIILEMRVLHVLVHFISKEKIQKTINKVFDILLTFLHKGKYSFLIRSLSFNILLAWFLELPFKGRKPLVKRIIPILHNEITTTKSRLAESMLDFFLKFTFVSCDQKISLDENMKKQFDNMEYRAWVLGNGILTSQVGKLGFVLVRYRRPTGNIGWSMKLINTLNVLNPLIPESVGTYEKRYVDEISNMSLPGSSKDINDKLSPLLNVVEVDTVSISPNNLYSDPSSSLESNDFMKEQEDEEVNGINMPINNPKSSKEEEIKDDFLTYNFDDEEHSFIFKNNQKGEEKKKKVVKNLVKRKNEKMYVRTTLNNNNNNGSNMTKSKGKSKPININNGKSKGEYFNDYLKSYGRRGGKEGVDGKGIRKEEEEKNEIMLNPNFPYLFLRSWTFQSREVPVGLRVCKELTNDLNVFDDTPAQEIHKIGIVFVEEEQFKEENILKNTYGSSRYFDFVRSLGKIVSLKDTDEMYAGGLDVNEKELKDGEYTIVSQNEVYHMVFHIATMMENKYLWRKKSHIGNDYVLIVYSENESVYDLDTIKSQKLYIVIVVYPLDKGFNKVVVNIRNTELLQILKFFPLEQIVSDDNLSMLIKILSLHSSLAINAFNKKNGNYEGVWSSRISKLKRIKQQYRKRYKVETGSKENFEKISLQRDIDDLFQD